MKKLTGIGFALVVVFGLSLPVEGASDTPKRGGTLTMAIRKDLTVMNPLVRTTSTDQSIRELMFESLLTFDSKGSLEPNLAESWEISKDGRMYSFRLRRDVKFHSGQEMTAEDAKFAVDYTMNLKNTAYGYERLQVVERVEAPDKYNLRFYLKRPSPAFLSVLGSIQAFSVIPKGSLQEGATKPASFPPGTGPFKFVEWKPTQQLVMERHDGYWGPKGFADRLILRPIPNETVRFTALRAGDVDIAEVVPYEWVKQITEGKIKGIKYVEASTAGFRVLKFNAAGPPFNNKQLRQAVAHALDRKQILGATYFGFGRPADQRYPKGHVWYFEGIRSPAYDLERARALLKESGYKGDPIPIMLRQGEQETEALTLQAQLKKIGINVKLDLLEYGSYVQRHRVGDYAFSASGGSHDPDPSPTYGPEYQCPSDLKKRTVNETGYCDKEMDELIRKMDGEMNTEKRREIVMRIVQKVAEDLPEIAIGFVPRFFAYRDSVKGFTTDGEGRFSGLHQTWLDK